jgi:chromosomal replication initiation ATPase DnaA
MSFKNDRSIDLITELSATFHAIGYDKTKEAVIRARENNDPKTNSNLIAKFILKETCKAFNISQERVIKGKTKGTRTDCLMIVFVLAKKHLQYSLSDSSKCFDKSISKISRSITTFNNLRESEKHGLVLLNKYQKINELVVAFKEKLLA